MNPEEQSQSTLESWKEIAAYLQRDAKTARRWEKEEGLPIHRHNHKSRSSVYAYPAEIDAWRVSRKTPTEPAAAPARPLWRVPAFAATILACLVMVGNGIRPAAAEQKPLAAHRLDTKGELGYDNLSPDGKWFGGTDWNNGDLVLAPVPSGEVRRLVKAAFDKQPESWGEAPVLSPDKKQVAYLWFDDGDPQASHGQLRLMPNEPGGKSRLLFGKPGLYRNSYPLAWSPDGKRILASLDKVDPDQAAASPSQPGRRIAFEIAWISVADGSVQVIKTLQPWQVSRNEALVSLSPDGRSLAYAARIRTDATETCICVLSADGTTESEVVRGDINESPVWAPDGTHILFTSNRSGTFGLWSVRVQDGKKAGLPVLLKPDTGRIRSIGITRSGTYYYNYNGNLNQVFVAEMDPATGKARGGTATVTESFVGVRGTWSRDGKWLAFKRQRAGANNYDLILHSMEKGAESTFAPQQMGPAPPMWFRDGSVQPIGRNPLRVTVNGGEPKEIAAPLGLPMGTLSPDDKLIYRMAHRDPQITTSPFEGVEVLDAATSERKQWFAVPGGVVYLALSLDGKTLAVEGGGNPNGRLAVISADGSGYREISSVPYGALGWTRDGRAILAGQQDKNSAVWRIMRVPIDGGQPEFTGISTEVLQSFELSPDGSKIVYSGMSVRSELWALDNVLAVLK